MTNTDNRHDWIDDLTPRTGLLIVCLGAVALLACAWGLFA